MPVHRSGAPYEIKDEPPLVGTRKFGLRLTDATWQKAFRTALGNRYSNGTLGVDERIASAEQETATAASERAAQANAKAEEARAVADQKVQDALAEWGRTHPT